jgi:hypothetical protein
MMTIKPFFLIGAERSGTTVLRLMLDSHPLVSWVNEFEYSVDRLRDPNAWPALGEYAEYLSSNRIFQATGFAIDSGVDYPALIASFLAQKQIRDNKPIIGATCHRHYDRLLRLFPDCRFIYLIRDPRDVARSNIGMGWAGNVWKGVDRWIEAENLWKTMKQTLPQSSYIEVRFEELIVNPEKVLGAICQFFNISYDARMLSYPERTTYSLPDPKLTEQWKKKMTAREIALVEAKAAFIMRKRGYHMISSPIMRPTFLERMYLGFQNKIFRVRFRIKRFGFWLILLDYIARKLRLKKLHHICKQRQNILLNRYIK